MRLEEMIKCYIIYYEFMYAFDPDVKACFDCGPECAERVGSSVERVIFSIRECAEGG